MNMFDIIRQRNMRETEELRATRLNDPTYNRVVAVPAPAKAVEEVKAEAPVEVEAPVKEAKAKKSRAK